MGRSTPVGVRFFEDVKVALQKAAKDDSRTMNQMIEKIVTDWLKANHYLENVNRN